MLFFIAEIYFFLWSVSSVFFSMSIYLYTYNYYKFSGRIHKVLIINKHKYIYVHLYGLISRLEMIFRALIDVRKIHNQTMQHPTIDFRVKGLGAKKYVRRRGKRSL